jgi:Na+/H+-dicarboxylate symporter
MSQSLKVLLGLLAGAALGLVLAQADPATAETVASLLQPIGKLWLNALQMTIVPLVVSLLVIGVATASDALSSGRLARDAMAWFVALLAFASFAAALVGPLVLSLLPRDPALVESLRAAITGPAPAPAAAGLADWFANVLPTNAIAAAAQGAIVPLVVFTLFLAFALNRLEPARRAPLLALFQSIADAMGVVVGWVLRAAPLGVFALILPVCARAGAGMLHALGAYILLLCAMYLAMTLLLYGVAVVGGRESLRRFATGILPAQAVAASTQSSLATLPAMLDCTRNKLGYPTGVTALVLPMAVSLFRITSPIQYMGVAAFIAWTYGIDLSLTQLAVGATLAVVISIGSVGLPGQASFMGTNLPVVQAMGLPVEPLGLLLAVDLVPDIFATLGNVTADMTVTAALSKGRGALPNPSPRPIGDAAVDARMDAAAADRG